MSSQATQLHGVDSLNYRYYPKLLGKCLQVIKGKTEVDMTVVNVEAMMVSTKVKPLIQQDNWAIFDEGMTVELAVALICDFFKVIQETKEEATPVNWYGLLYWVAELYPALTKQSQNHFIRTFGKCRTSEPEEKISKDIAVI